MLSMHDPLYFGDGVRLCLRKVSLAADVFLDQKQIHGFVGSRSIAFHGPLRTACSLAFSQ